MTFAKFSERDALFQCVPNFSEGRRPEVVAALVESVSSVCDVHAIDCSMDPDHNRCVITLLGTADGIVAAMKKLAAIALETIDLRKHAGIHPRLGAIDVVPVVPIRNAGMRNADAAAREIGAFLANSLKIPVYFYEASATPGRINALPDLRKHARNIVDASEISLSGTHSHVELSGDLAPDLGPKFPHHSAGISVVGARRPLVAYNIDLDTQNLSIATHIARLIRDVRSSNVDLSGVRALGLYLPTRGCAQVSMNLTRPDITSMLSVYRFVELAAANLGVATLQSEVIGVVPQSSLAGHSPDAIRWYEYAPQRILEYWLS